MRRNVAALILLFLALVAALGPATLAAQQPEPQLVLDFQPGSSVGKRLAVSAYLLDPAGNPIQGEVVTFSIDAEFMNTLGRIEIGQSTTDDNGLALLVYTPTMSGERTVLARYGGNDVFTGTETTKTIVTASGPELYEEETPFRIPGANMGLVVGVLVAIWSLYLMVIGLFWLISRSGSAGSAESEVRQ